MRGTQSGRIVGWRQVMPARGSPTRHFLPMRAVARGPSGEAIAKDRWESEGGSLAAPALRT